MNRQQVKVLVEAYRRHSTAYRSFKRRQKPLRGQRGSSTGLQHSLAMDEVLKLLTEAGHTKIVGLLKDWHDRLNLAALGHVKATEYRAIARGNSGRINRLVEAIPFGWPEGKRVR